MSLMATNWPNWAYPHSLSLIIETSTISRRHWKLVDLRMKDKVFLGGGMSQGKISAYRA